MGNNAQRLRGEVVIPTPISTGVLTGIIVSIVLLGLIGAGFAQYSRTEAVTGWLVPEGGLIRVTAQGSGSIVAVHAHEGSMVEARAHLATLRLTATDIAGGDFGSAVSSALAEERAAQAREGAAAVASLEAQRGSLRTRESSLAVEIGELRRAVEISEERERLSNARVARLEQVEKKGFISAQNMDDRRLAALNAAQQTASARVALAAARREWASLTATLGDLPRDIAAIRAQTEGRQAAFAQREVLANQTSEISAIAPIDAKVLAIPVSLGQSIIAGSTIAVLAPSRAPLIAELFVPARAAGFVAPGQEVRLMYSAYPYQKFGSSKGRVVRVAATVLSPAEIAASGFRVDEPAFKVYVELERDTIDAYGRTINLAPGASLNAQIVIDRRSLLEWLFDPLFAAGRRL